MPKISKYNGGYVIISLNDEDIYEKIERNLYKPILLTDIVINGIEKNDVFTTAYVEGTNIVFKDIYDKDITISADNSVSIGNPKRLYINIININDVSDGSLSGLILSIIFYSYKKFDNIEDFYQYFKTFEKSNREILAFRTYYRSTKHVMGYLFKFNPNFSENPFATVLNDGYASDTDLLASTSSTVEFINKPV